jgi:hypothetical protein
MIDISDVYLLIGPQLIILVTFKLKMIGFIWCNYVSLLLSINSHFLWLALKAFEIIYVLIAWLILLYITIISIKYCVKLSTDYSKYKTLNIFENNVIIFYYYYRMMGLCSHFVPPLGVLSRGLFGFIFHLLQN